MPTAFSMRRLLAVSATVFVLLLAFLAGRVRAGADPAQTGTPAAHVQPAQPRSSGGGDAGGTYGEEGSGDDWYGDDDGPVPGYAPDQGTVPGQGALPGQGVVPSPGGQDAMPPTTHAS